MAKQYSVTFNSYNNWKLPINLAIGFHLVVALGLVYLPGIMKSKPKFEDIYEVNLINFTEPAPVVEEPSAPPAEQQPPPPPEPLKTEKAVPIAEVTKPPQPVAPPKAISIKPLKRKIKKTVVEKTKVNENKEKELDRLKRQQIAETLRAEQARREAEEAARQQKLMEEKLAAIKNQVRTTTRPISPARPSRNSDTASLLEQQYRSSLMSHIARYWSLPQFKQWDPSLMATIVITISANGSVTNMFFEKGSGDPSFDQYVRKAIQDATPLPEIPPALRKKQEEIGIHFTPKNIK